MDESIGHVNRDPSDDGLPPRGSLAYELSDAESFGLTVREAAAKPVPTSRAERRTGESFTDYGNRLKSGDRRLARQAEAKKGRDGKKKGAKTRSGGDAEFEKAHPRSRDGSWTLKQGATGDEVRGIQRKIGGTKVDGQFGGSTKAAIMRYQRKHGLQVDGVVGAQTIASLRGKKGVKPGAASAQDRRFLKAAAKRPGKS